MEGHGPKPRGAQVQMQVWLCAVQAKKPWMHSEVEEARHCCTRRELQVPFPDDH